MFLGKVIGRLTPCVVADGLQGVPFLIVQPLNTELHDDGATFVAADPTRMADCGELIYYEKSREAALALDPSFVPVDHAIIGIVDGMRLEKDGMTK